MTGTTTAFREEDQKFTWWYAFRLGVKQQWHNYAAIIVLVMSTAAMAIAITSLSELRQQNQNLRENILCQDAVNTALITSLQISREQGKQDRDATDALLNAVGKNPENIDALLDVYNTTRKSTEEQRVLNPLPAPSTCAVPN